MVTTVKEFMDSSGSGGSQKRKRDEMGDSDEYEGDDAISESMDMDEACHKLVNGEETPEQLAEGEDNVLAELSKIYNS